MYPALPRWSDVNNGVVPTNRRPSKAPTPPRAPPTQVEVASPEVLLPSASSSPSQSSTVQTKKTGHSGPLFVNHNAVPVAAAAPQTSVSLPVAGPPSSSPAQGAVRGGCAHAPAKQQPGRGGGPIPLYYHSNQNTAAASGPGGRETSYDALRPLNGAKRQGLVRGTTVVNNVELRHYSAAPLSLGVEGVQTGEEVLVDSTEVRHRSFANNDSGSSTACQNPHDHVQVPQLKRQLDKANASMKSLTAANRRQKLEYDAQKAGWELQLAEYESRLRAALSHNREREGLLSQHASSAVKRCSAEVQKATQLHSSTVAAHAADKDKWEDELASLRRELEAAKIAIATQAAAESADAAHQREVEQLKAELEALRQSSASKQRELETTLTDAQSSLNKTKTELEECRKVQQQCNYLVQQCRLFIRQVCQPGFSVVKGPSLEPVEKNRPEPTGFVLVPLVVLLHGYSLLPEGDQQEVIDHYDNAAKALH
ncbi:hypothetical protein ABB37_05134 [Leptomonas pyrrhocoris]|uniref:Uncharacterized protein n=1 Tax=Leptomonas pyrrhocoris TaxID=157538 RepID=A0A0M9G110_LEPPY|nr:hypothetical protein ABB37_05134 [Leptomonas pyrrhocoris]XP_015658585.1 hypothetical protein ABB37_05134 [Leptomonas pyrrhocoris]KPA80145.1 hypothetical protein ABB37_05134 [Leptomonas pyrrhocoris]KPA80146.1 hypothetical protein ABB37_05134 [Leptomonas pyrrhocoris]|eukprot:XP_015658584.1 hypothetical protein ABB37_05134 [Leptomonas pyrrhocoris]